MKEGPGGFIGFLSFGAEEEGPLPLDFLPAFILKGEKSAHTEISLLGTGLGRKEGLVEGVGLWAKTGTCSAVILFNLGCAADNFSRLAVERVGSSKVQISRIENGLEQSKIEV